MSIIHKGTLIESDLTRNARGGTEQMRDRLLKYVDPNLLKKVSIQISRPSEKIDLDLPSILYCHDLANDPAVASLSEDPFDKYVFVSYWQRDQFIQKFGLPYSKCTVIQNAIETEYDSRIQKPTDKIRFIYHTTPHRGLELVYPIFDLLSKTYPGKLHLDVFSSFSVYGWHQRDQQFENLFQDIRNHPDMTYHGAKSNAEVLGALEKAHIFLYPSIWQETSCIAMIEAMHSGCVCIYPSYGALPETGSLMSRVGMYEYSENMEDNAKSAFSFADYFVRSQLNDSNYLKSLVSGTCVNSTHILPIFKKKWETLISSLLIERQTK